MTSTEVPQNMSEWAGGPTLLRYVVSFSTAVFVMRR
jgi:hypothetical protein